VTARNLTRIPAAGYQRTTGGRAPRYLTRIRCVNGRPFFRLIVSDLPSADTWYSAVTFAASIPGSQ